MNNPSDYGYDISGQLPESPPHDLGQGWWAKFGNDGTLSLRNPDRGQRITLNADEVERLRAIFNS
jgi:hypothetical protein